MWMFNIFIPLRNGRLLWVFLGCVILCIMVPCAMQVKMYVFSIVNMGYTGGMSTSSSRISDKNMHGRPDQKETVKDKYVVYTCNTGRCGGLADRQKGIVTAFVLSQMLGRLFGISMFKPCDISEFVIPKDVDWTIDSRTLAHLKKEWFVDMDGNGMGVAMATGDLEAMFQNDGTMYTGNIDLVPYLMKNPLFHKVYWARRLSHLDIYKYAFEKLFKLSHKTQDRFDDIIGTIDSNHQTLVCAHIRMGKSRTIPRDNSRKAHRPDPDSLIRFFKTRLHPGYDKLFIATDSQQVRLRFKKAFPDSYLEVKGQIAHIDRPSRTFECSAMEKVVLDQYILSECDTLVMSVSGFSRFAAIMRGRDGDLFLARGKNVSVSPRLSPTL
ncbi:uncharacterized protein LOC124125198 [Haliotis rufescens]|uniref:uncharacterized protein LOC124125198 n=1 Tax=Haliotis rufescens TaxID=6454 RepID=UPI00201F5BDD|nr:uncharacterized protein LOC124125198 [Haliotis rufescens]